MKHDKKKGIFESLELSVWNSLLSVKKKPFGIVYQVLFDIIFMFAYGAVVIPFLKKVVEQISAIVAVSSAEMAGQGLPTLHTMLSSPGAVQYMHNIFWLYVLAGLGFFITYSFFQGINWKVAAGMAGKKAPFRKYLPRFFLVNILWIILYAFHFFIELYLEVLSGVSQRVPHIQEPYILAAFAFVFWAAIIYFAVISYYLAAKMPAVSALKKSFSFGISKFHRIIPMFIAVGIAFIAVEFFLRLFSGRALMIAGILIFLPVIAWARVFIFHSLEEG